MDPFIPATRAILLATLVFLFVGDIFAGFSLLWIFFGRVLSLPADPAVLIRLRYLLAQKAAVSSPAQPTA